MRILRMLTYAGLGYSAYKGYRSWRARSMMRPKTTSSVSTMGRTKPL